MINTNETATLTRLTSASGNPCGKRLSLDADGKLVKKPLAHALNTANQARVDIADAQALADLLDGLTSSQALAFGVSNSEFENIITRKAKKEGAVGGTRTREDFAWPEGAGVMMLDYDPVPGTEPMSKDELLDALYAICPAIKSAWHVWRPSAGSCIFADDGTEIRGISGQRIYVLVRDAGDIPRAGAVLHSLGWLAGHGYYLVSKSGALLERGLFDATVFQPERLDFCGPSDCTDGLVQRMPATEAMGEGLLDTRAVLPDLSDKRMAPVKGTRRLSRNALKPEQAEARSVYIEERAPELMEQAGIDRATAVEALRAATESNKLLADFVLQYSGGHVTVNELLDDPEKWQHHGFLDPLEPEYQPSNYRIARAELFNGGQPSLWSFAHGGTRYTLHRQRQKIELTPGGEVEDADKVLEALQSRDPLLFQRGVGAQSELVAVHGQHLIQVCEVRLSDRIGRVLTFDKYDGRSSGMKPAECAKGIISKVHKRVGAWGLRDLRGIITVPTMRPDGSLLGAPGYDQATGLLLLNQNGEVFAVPDVRDKETLRKTLEYLLYPFRKFPLQDETDNGVLLAAIFTAIVRRPMPTAPAFLFGASTAGSGKTLLASAVGYLASGADPDPQAWPEGFNPEEEAKKMLFASLRDTNGVLLIDNIEGQIKSASLAAVLTKPTYVDRVLGESRRVSVPTNALVLLSGNNVSVVGDLNRRVLRCRIDPQMERPDTRAFAFDPLTMVKQRRVNMCRAGLVLLQAYQANGKRLGQGSTASFETWDSIVRQAVCWLADLLPDFGLADPTRTIDEGFADDPELEQLREFLQAWRGKFGGDAKRIKEVREAVKGLKSGSADAKTMALHDVCMDIAGGRDGEVDGHLLRGIIKRFAGRIVDGMTLVKFRRDANNGDLWAIRDTRDIRDSISHPPKTVTDIFTGGAVAIPSISSIPYVSAESAAEVEEF